MNKYSDKHIVTISPSQWVNALWIIIGVVGFQFILPPLVAVYKILEIYFTRYSFHEKSIIERKGVLDVERKEMLKYRIKSVRVSEPLWMRLFGLSVVYIRSSDPYQPELILYAVPKGVSIWKGLREEVHYARLEENVREFDFFNM
jgi:uncharacterized membrane protein YdbT with pleckstrin-like domain